MGTQLGLQNHPLFLMRIPRLTTFMPTGQFQPQLSACSSSLPATLDCLAVTRPCLRLMIRLSHAVNPAVCSQSRCSSQGWYFHECSTSPQQIFSWHPVTRGEGGIAGKTSLNDEKILVWWQRERHAAAASTNGSFRCSTFNHLCSELQQLTD